MKERMKFKILTYDIDYDERFGKDYPRIEAGSMFFMENNPWSNIRQIIRKMTVIYNLYRWISCDHEISILDCGAGFAENRIYLDRFRKPKGMRIKYTAIDSDPDKRNISLLINPSINYIVSRLEDYIPESKYDAIICNDLFKFYEKDSGIEIFNKIFEMLKICGIMSLSNTTPYLTDNGDLYEYYENIKYLRSSKEMIEMVSKRDIEILDSFHFGLKSKDLEVNSSRVPLEIKTYSFSLLQDSPRGTRFQIYLRKTGD